MLRHAARAQHAGGRRRLSAGPRTSPAWEWDRTCRRRTQPDDGQSFFRFTHALLNPSRFVLATPCRSTKPSRPPTPTTSSRARLASFRCRPLARLRSWYVHAIALRSPCGLGLQANQLTRRVRWTAVDMYGCAGSSFECAGPQGGVRRTRSSLSLRRHKPPAGAKLTSLPLDSDMHVIRNAGARNIPHQDVGCCVLLLDWLVLCCACTDATQAAAPSRPFAAW